MSKKPLPSISAPTLVTLLPLSGIKVKYRPFVIKEQKALLLAQESKDPEVVLETIKSVISSCTQGTLDFGKTPTADLAYFFVQLRMASVGPEVKFSIKCSNCEATNAISMSLADVVLDGSKIERDIKITDSVGIKFRLPTIEDSINAGVDGERSIKMLYQLIECIYDEDSVYEKSDYTVEEFVDWIEGMDDSQVGRIRKFVDSIPQLTHTLDFNCVECNHKQSRQLEGLHNFFRLGTDSR